jgi:hypothetical protein
MKNRMLDLMISSVRRTARRFLQRPVLALLLGGGLALTGCTEEGPVAVGGSLLPGAVRTYELLLDASEFLVADTAAGGFTRPAAAGFMLAAHQADGLDAHALVRFTRFPGFVGYFDAAGQAQTDTMPRYFGGTVVFRLDTLRSGAPGPVVLHLYRTAEAFDPLTATWSLRIDSAGVQQPWSQPGGTSGALLDSAVWQPGADSVTFAVDSQTVALWGDTLNAARGALLVPVTPDARLRVTGALIRLQARPSARPDTIVAATAAAAATTFLYDPPAPRLSSIQVGGVPAWRSFLQFREDLGDVPFRCPDVEGSGCTVRLRDATINYAAILLEPLVVAAPFTPRDTIRLEARAVRPSPLAPLLRSPLGERVGQSRSLILPERFSGDAPGTPIELTVTPFLARLAGAQQAGVGNDTLAARILAVTLPFEGTTFGIAAFGGRQGPGTPPRLRIVLSLPSESQVR